MILVIYLLSGVAFSVVAVAALPLLLPQPKPPSEADKSPAPPKLAIRSYLLGVICSVRPAIEPRGEGNKNDSIKIENNLFVFFLFKRFSRVNLGPCGA